MATLRRRKAAAGDHGGGGGGGGHGGASGRWLVSYADFITLMFVVFLVLFSMARVDLSKYGALANSLKQSMGVPGPSITKLPTRSLNGQAEPVKPPETPGTVPDLPDWTSRILVEQPGERVIPPQQAPNPDAPKDPGGKNPVETPSGTTPPDELSKLSSAFEALPGARTGTLQLALKEHGLNISIAGNVLFDPGQTTLRLDAKGILDQVAAQLKDTDLPVWVTGTADDRPVDSKLSFWDLAALRAGAVVQYMVVDKGLPQARFVTIGYGASRIGAPDRMVTIAVMRKN